MLYTSQRGVGQCSEGRLIGNSQLGKSDFRPLGVTDSTVLQPRVSYSSHPVIFSRAGTFAWKPRDTYEGGDKKFIRKRGHREDEGTTPSSIYFTDVPCPKKGQINEASVQSERTESVPTLGTFQNGKRSDDQRSYPRRRLDGKNGSEGFLPCPANQARGSEVVEVPMGKGDL